MPEKYGNARFMIVWYCYDIQTTLQRQNFEIVSTRFNQNIAIILPITPAMIIFSKNPLHAALPRIVIYARVKPIWVVFEISKLRFRSWNENATEIPIWFDGILSRARFARAKWNGAILAGERINLNVYFFLNDILILKLIQNSYFKFKT